MSIIVNRITPGLPAAAYKTYVWRRPLTTHWRKASCWEIGCPAFRNGWETTVDISTDLGKRQYDYLTHDKSRKYTVEKMSTGLIKFIYGPGFICFRSAEHRTRIDREPLMLVTGGDYRGNPAGAPTVVHKNREDWVDDFATHQEKLIKAAQ